MNTSLIQSALQFWQGLPAMGRVAGIGVLMIAGPVWLHSKGDLETWLTATLVGMGFILILLDVRWIEQQAKGKGG